MRRLDARRYPMASAELRFLDAAGHLNRYQVHGDLTLHGVTRTMIGALAVDFDGKSVVRVYGDKVVDIRDFNIPSPTMLMLRIYPDVRVRISLIAEAEALTVDSQSED
jgi:polyisoprenoid-binding protein YceI